MDNFQALRLENYFKMAQNNFIFDPNTLTLYAACRDQSLEELELSNFSDIVDTLTEIQKCQYKFWLSLPNSQKEYIKEQLTRNECVVANVKLFPVQTLEY
jgi:hypothetical protein